MPENRSGIIAYFSQNHVAAGVLVLLVFIGGLTIGNLLNVGTFPTYDPRMVLIKVPYPGATPTEVEEDIIKRIEESLLGTIGVDRTISSSKEGVGLVHVELTDFVYDVDALNNVRTAVERIEDFPPPLADDPEITLAEVNRNVLTVAVSSDSLEQYRLRQFAESLRDKLLLIPNVAIIDLFGTRDQEIQVEISEETLRKYRLDLLDILDVIRNSSINLSGGELKTVSGDIMLSTLQKRDWALEYKDIVVIAREDGTLIRLGDIATIKDGLVEHDTFTSLNGVPTIFLQVRVSPGASPQEVSESVQAYLNGYDAPPSTTISIYEDESWVVQDRLYLILENAIYGGLLVFLTLLLFFDLRIAIWVTAGVPIAFVGSLMFFPAFDLSINVVTLFAFFIMIGMVVDDSIVVGESIATYRDRGLEAVDASIFGAKAVLGSIIVGSATTITAFFTLYPLQGELGQMFSVIPIVVALVLLISLFEAVLVLPGHLGKEKPWSAWPLSGIQGWVRDSFQEFIESRIVPLISWSVRHPFAPPLIVAASVLLAALMVQVDVVKYSPDLNLVEDQNLQVDLELPIDSNFKDVQTAVDYVVAAAERINETTEGSAFNAVTVVIGQHKPMENFQGAIEATEYEENLASVQLRLNSPPIRKISVYEFKELWRQALRDTPSATTVSFPTRQNQPAFNLSYALIHPDQEVLRVAAGTFTEQLLEFEGVYDVRDSIEKGKRRFDLTINKTGLSSGLTARSVAGQLRGAFHGAEAQRIQRGREEIRVMVRYPDDRRASYGEMLNERIYRPGGAQVPLYTVADLTEVDTISNRLRIDHHSAVVVTALFDIAILNSAQIIEEVESELLPQILAEYPDMEIQKHDVTRNVEEVNNTLAFTFIIAILVIYCLIGSFLRSFIQPLLALAGIPMAFVGAIIGHWVLGYELTNTSFFGLIAVSGVIVNDTILVMNRYNTIRIEREDFPAIAAISAATQQRARAILLTSVTTVMGLLPLLFSQDEAIQFLIPLIVSLAFGLIFAGIGLLFFLPAILMVVELAKDRVSGMRMATQS